MQSIPEATAVPPNHSDDRSRITRQLGTIKATEQYVVLITSWESAGTTNRPEIIFDVRDADGCDLRLRFAVNTAAPLAGPLADFVHTVVQRPLTHPDWLSQRDALMMHLNGTVDRQVVLHVKEGGQGLQAVVDWERVLPDQNGD